MFEFLLDVDRDDHVGAAVRQRWRGRRFHPAVDVVAAVDGNGREYAGMDMLATSAWPNCPTPPRVRRPIRCPSPRCRRALQVFDAPPVRWWRNLERAGLSTAPRGGTYKVNRDVNSTSLASVARLSVENPAAYRPDTMLPMLEPTTTSTGMPSSSNALRSPMWLIPLAAPPPSTTATVGRVFSLAAAVESASATSCAEATGRRSFHRPRTDDHGEKADKRKLRETSGSTIAPPRS